MKIDLSWVIIFMVLVGSCFSGGVISELELLGYPQKITKTLQSITFDSDYDNGSLYDVRVAGKDEFECELFLEHGEIGPRRYWFRFRMTGVAGRKIILHLEHRSNPRPVIKTGKSEWRRMTEQEAPTSQLLVLSFNSHENEAEVAFYFPSGVKETYNYVDEYVGCCGDAKMEVLGYSFEGRKMRLVTVTDHSPSTFKKRRVWMHSRAHSGEVTSTLVMLGFLDFITRDTPEARRLRRSCIFNVVPIVNVDGVFQGLTRWDTQGIDPEHIWDNPYRIPETTNTKGKIDEFMGGANPIEVSLNLHSTVRRARDTFFFKHAAPSVTKEFEDKEQRYIDALDRATPLFDNLSETTSQLDEWVFVESYYWRNWGESVMAMTHEGHFHKRITDGAWITDKDYHDIGGAMAKALIEYFDLPEYSGESGDMYWMLRDL